MKKDVERVLFRCPLINAPRRDELSPVKERKHRSLVELVQKWLLKLLAFLRIEKYIDGVSTNAHEMKGDRPQ